MDFNQRITKIKDFYKNSQINYNKKFDNGKFIYHNIELMFTKKKLTSGLEGDVYVGNLKDNSLKDPVIIKVTKLQNLIKHKGVSKTVLNRNPLYIYNLFKRLQHKDKNFPVLIESIAYTLIDQLVLQKICPMFNLNFYWEYENSVINYYNEFVNNGTFFEWYRTCTDQEAVNVFMQIIIGIIAMQKYYKMTHGDLHSNNILIQKVKPGGVWKFQINDKEFMIPNIGWMVVINDFGFATILSKVELDWYVQDYLSYLKDDTINFYDIFYFIESIQFHIDKSNHHLFKKTVHDILKIFNLFDVYDAIKNNKYNNNKKNIHYKKLYTMIDVLDLVYFNYCFSFSSNESIIETYSLNKKLKVNLLPQNFESLVQMK